MKRFILALLVTALCLGAIPALAQMPTSPTIQSFSCFVEAVTVTTQCFAAQTSPNRLYIVSVTFSNEVATAQTLDLVYGTGTNCATGTTALTNKMQFGAAVGNYTFDPDPVAFIVPAGQNVCIRPTAATAFGATLLGMIAP